MPEVEFYEDGESQWRWRVKAGNGEVVATGESHTRERDAVRAFLNAATLLEDAKEVWLMGDNVSGG